MKVNKKLTGERTIQMYMQNWLKCKSKLPISCILMLFFCFFFFVKQRLSSEIILLAVILLNTNLKEGTTLKVPGKHFLTSTFLFHLNWDPFLSWRKTQYLALLLRDKSFFRCSHLNVHCKAKQHAVIKKKEKCLHGCHWRWFKNSRVIRGISNISCNIMINKQCLKVKS